MNAAAIVTVPDDATLSDCENVIEENLLAFVKVGLALQAIRERKLYKTAENPDLTWTEYLKVRWDYSRAHAGRVIKGANTFELLSSVYGEENLPHHERPLREFVSQVPEAAQVAVWAIIAQTAPAGVVTGKHIELVVSTLKEVVHVQAVENGDGGQVHVSEALKVQVTSQVYELYKSERAYMDATATPPLYHGRGLVVALEGSRVTLELEAAPDVELGQLVKVYLNQQKERG